MRIALINPNTSDDITRRMVAIASRHATCVIEGLTAPFGAPLITTPEALDRATEAVLALLPQLAVHDGVMVAAFGDPGQARLAERLSVPVVGIAQAAMAEARAVADRFAVVTTTPALADRIGGRAADLGHAQAFAGTWVTPGDPAALTADPARLRAALHGAALRALSDDPGIGAIIIGGGPLAEAARDMAADVPVPIIQPIPAAMRLLQSRLSTRTEPT